MKRPPCYCERLTFPHRRTDECEELEEQQEAAAAEEDAEQWSSWCRDRAADARALR